MVWMTVEAKVFGPFLLIKNNNRIYYYYYKRDDINLKMYSLGTTRWVLSTYRVWHWSKKKNIYFNEMCLLQYYLRIQKRVPSIILCIHVYVYGVISKLSRIMLSFFGKFSTISKWVEWRFKKKLIIKKNEIDILKIRKNIYYAKTKIIIIIIIIRSYAVVEDGATTVGCDSLNDHCYH